jgi:hypothetical protein
MKNKSKLRLLIEAIENAPEYMTFSELQKLQHQCGYRRNSIPTLITAKYERVGRGLYKRIGALETARPIKQVERKLTPKENFLQSITDSQIISEIRKRGYSGEIHKKITV